MIDSCSTQTASLHLDVVTKTAVDDEADLDDSDTCSVSSADEEAEMCFFGAWLSEEERRDLVLPYDDDNDDYADDDDSPRQTILDGGDRRTSYWSDFAHERVSTFEKNMKTIISEALDDDIIDYDDDVAVPTRESGCSMCTMKTFNSMMSDDCSSEENNNISAIALIEKERRESSMMIHQMNDDDDDDDSSRKQNLIDFVAGRVETFSKNVDFAQEKAETFTRNIAEKVLVMTPATKTIDPDEDLTAVAAAAVVKCNHQKLSSLSVFVQKRRNTFERNMTTISSAIAASQA